MGRWASSGMVIQLARRSLVSLLILALKTRKWYRLSVGIHTLAASRKTDLFLFGEMALMAAWEIQWCSTAAHLYKFLKEIVTFKSYASGCHLRSQSIGVAVLFHGVPVNQVSWVIKKPLKCSCQGKSKFWKDNLFTNSLVVTSTR